jgi:hypothetical protein
LGRGSTSSVRVGGACGPPPPFAAPLRCALSSGATPRLVVSGDGAERRCHFCSAPYRAAQVTIPIAPHSLAQLSGGSPRKRARSAAEQRTGAGGRRLPRPGTYGVRSAAEQRTGAGGRRLPRPGSAVAPPTRTRLSQPLQPFYYSPRNRISPARERSSSGSRSESGSSRPGSGTRSCRSSAPGHRRCVRCWGRGAGHCPALRCQTPCDPRRAA